MKQLIMMAGLIFMSAFAMAQVRPKPLNATIKTPTATCEACKTKIESFVSKSIDGLIKIRVSTSAATTTVQYYPDRTNIEEIKAAISNAGFTADDFEANMEVYVKLPDCCKKPEDRKAPPPAKKY